MGKGILYVLDALCGRWSALQREQIIKETATTDGEAVSIRVEQQPGSGGKESLRLPSAILPDLWSRRNQ